jgi:hypothetical protein
MPLQIESALVKASRDFGIPFADRYEVLKHRLFNTEYEHVHAGFPSGTNHGQSHIQRVLEKLDRLLDDDPLVDGAINAYELFLAMVSILYHDIGLLRDRKGHQVTSAIFVGEEKNEYVIDAADRDIIQAAVVSHSSSEDIEMRCSRFADIEIVGAYSVRPRFVAALVRLADELDDDYRRADATLEERLNPTDESRFFWRAAQCIRGILPVRRSRQIRVDVKFELEDCGSFFDVRGEPRAFIGLFAEKLAKMNSERKLTTKYLPPTMQYEELRVSVKPLDQHERWISPRDFVFGTDTPASAFVLDLPELLEHPASEWLRRALESIRSGQLDEADAELDRLQRISADLSDDFRLRVLYDKACVASLRAGLFGSPNEWDSALTQAVDYLRQWFQLGMNGPWTRGLTTPPLEVHRMGSDGDLAHVLDVRNELIHGMLGDLASALPAKLPVARSRDAGGGGGGCVKRGTLVKTPKGSAGVQELLEGDEIISLDTDTGSPITARILQVHTFREPKGLMVNDHVVVTPSQPLYQTQRSWIKASDMVPGTQILSWEFVPEWIVSVKIVEEYLEVFTLTTDHPSHNYLAGGLVCANKMPPPERD